MATDPNIRDLFRAGPAPTGRPIDTDAVIRRSKRRRLPAQLGLGGVATLAIGGIGVVTLQNLDSSVSPVSIMGGTAESGQAYDAPYTPAQEGAARDGSAQDTTVKRAPADRINLCGGPLAEVAPSATGLVLTPSFPDATAGASRVEGTVTLSNTGSGSITGYSAASPAITLSQNGVVLWHSNGPTVQMIQDVVLAPGESLEYQASFSPVVCSVDDDLAESFPDGLPAVQPGEYQVSAAADVVLDGGAELVTGPQQTVRIG
jgi:hypothetical protein